MRLFLLIFIPLLVSLLCAAGWVGLVVFIGFDAPWFGWGAGLLVGAATWLVSRNTPSRRRGVWSLVCAFLAICLSLYTIFALQIDRLQTQQRMLADDTDSYLWNIATDIAEEWEAEGMKLDWPPGADASNALYEEDFPPKVWRAAMERWQSLTPEEQDEERLFQQVLRSAMNTQFHAAGGKQRLIVRELVAFTPPITFLFVALGLFSAYRLGAGIGKNDSKSP